MRLHEATAAALVLLLLAGLRSPAGAQSVNTLCWQTGNMMQCNSSVGIQYVPDYTAYAAQQFAEGIRVGLEARRRAQAQRQVKAAEQARQGAMIQLFSERAKEVLAYVVMQTRIEGPVGEQFIAAAAKSLEALFLVKPTATQAEMVEVVIPHYQRMMREFGVFMERLLPPFTSRLQAAGAPLSPEQRQALALELGAAMTSLYMRKPSASADEFGQAVDAVLVKFRTPR